MASRILHISDLHFGRTRPQATEAILRLAWERRPDLVVISGDLTQRARRAQFREARQFLDRLPGPWLAVPGNHDIPLYEVLLRFLNPYRNYREFVSETLEPKWSNSEIAVIGVNTIRRFRVQEGDLKERRLRRIQKFIQGLRPGTLRILVGHHPEALAHTELLQTCQPDLLLSGHLHVAHSAITSEVLPGFQHRTALHFHAGTSTSSRFRNETNSCNWIHLEPSQVSFETFQLEPEAERFAPSRTRRFRLEKQGWTVDFNSQGLLTPRIQQGEP